MGKVLTKKFFERDVLVVAQELLGKFLVHCRGGAVEAFMITEVEAYDGCDDKACHASRGRTPRTEVMFGEAGRFYVYLVYGMHEMLNIVTGPKEYPAAVLIRGIEGVAGPGRVTSRLSVTRSFNGKKSCRKTGLWIEDRGGVVPKTKVKRTPRIGVDYAGSVWANKHYRFVLEDA